MTTFTTFLPLVVAALTTIITLITVVWKLSAIISQMKGTISDLQLTIVDLKQQLVDLRKIPLIEQRVGALEYLIKTDLTQHMADLWDRIMILDKRISIHVVRCTSHKLEEEKNK